MALELESVIALTGDDELKAKMITILLLVRMLLIRLQQDNDNKVSVEESSFKAAKDYGNLMRTAIKLFPGQGAQMDAEIKLFAKKLGFEIDERMVSQSTTTKQ